MDLIKVYHNDSRSYSSEPFPYEVPVGSIIRWTGDITGDPPKGTLWCDGSEVTIASYKELYEVIEDFYGIAEAGKFKLPLIKGSVIVFSGYGEAKDGYDDVVDITDDIVFALDPGEFVQVWRCGNLVRVNLGLATARTASNITNSMPKAVDSGIYASLNVITGDGSAFIDQDGNLTVTTTGYSLYSGQYLTKEEWV